MLAVSSAGWTGMGFIEDIDSGVMDRMLASPVWRGALNLGSVLQASSRSSIQTLLIVLLALALGAHYDNGVGGVLVLMLVAALLGAAFASLSNGLAVVTRQRESLIGAVTMVLLPLTFLSSALMQQSLVPGLDRHRGEVQPGQLGRRGRPLGGVRADRLGPGAPAAWRCWGRLGVVAASLATRAFGAYQRLSDYGLRRMLGGVGLLLPRGGDRVMRESKGEPCVEEECRRRGQRTCSKALRGGGVELATVEFDERVSVRG